MALSPGAALSHLSRQSREAVPQRYEAQHHGHDFYQAKAARLQRTARILRERSMHQPRAEKPFVEATIPVLDFANVPRSGETVLSIGLQPPDDGHVVLGHGVRAGYFSQEGEALEGTLAQYPGTIVFVSHDRFFVETLANEVIELGSTH